MKIELTEEQLECLVKLVYLGNVMANTWRTKDVIKEYDDVESLVLAAAVKNGLEDRAEFEKAEKRYVPSADLEEEMAEAVDFYDDNTFWDQLIFRMADRDFGRKYGEDALDELTTEKGTEREKPLLDKYEKEFNEHGLDRLEIRRDN
jgi:hypothetical protein